MLCITCSLTMLLWLSIQLRRILYPNFLIFFLLILQGNHSAFIRFPVTLSSSPSSTSCFNNSQHSRSFINIKISLPLTLDQDVIESHRKAKNKKVHTGTKNNYYRCVFDSIEGVHTHTGFLERTREVSICIFRLING